MDKKQQVNFTMRPWCDAVPGMFNGNAMIPSTRPTNNFSIFSMSGDGSRLMNVLHMLCCRT